MKICWPLTNIKMIIKSKTIYTHLLFFIINLKDKNCCHQMTDKAIKTKSYVTLLKKVVCHTASY